MTTIAPDVLARLSAAQAGLAMAALAGAQAKQADGVLDTLKGYGQQGLDWAAQKARPAVDYISDRAGQAAGDQTAANLWSKVRSHLPDMGGALPYVLGGAGLGALAGGASGLMSRKKKTRAIGDALTGGLMGGLAGRALGMLAPQFSGQTASNNQTGVQVPSREDIPPSAGTVARNKIQASNALGDVIARGTSATPALAGRARAELSRYQANPTPENYDRAARPGQVGLAAPFLGASFLSGQNPVGAAASLLAASGPDGTNLGTANKLIGATSGDAAHRANPGLAEYLQGAAQDNEATLEKLRQDAAREATSLGKRVGGDALAGAAALPASYAAQSALNRSLYNRTNQLASRAAGQLQLNPTGSVEALRNQPWLNEQLKLRLGVNDAELARRLGSKTLDSQTSQALAAIKNAPGRFGSAPLAEPYLPTRETLRDVPGLERRFSLRSPVKGVPSTPAAGGPGWKGPLLRFLAGMAAAEGARQLPSPGPIDFSLPAGPAVPHNYGGRK